MGHLGYKFMSKIVKNDSMKLDPPEIYGWRIFMLALSACFGGMLFGFDIGTIGGILTMPEFQAKYGIPMGTSAAEKTLRANLSANIASTLQAGCFFGCLIAFWTCDRFGRRWTLMNCSLVTIVGVVMQAAGSGHIEVMYIGRLVAGFGVGAASMAVPLYISENAPRAIRGGLTGLYQLFIASGTMLAFWTNYGCSLNIKGEPKYIVPLVMQAIPAVILYGTMFLNKESPRWLAKVDRWDEATLYLSRVRHLSPQHEYIKSELQDIKAQLDHERMLIGDATIKDLLREMWVIPGNRKRLLITIGLMVCQQMTGTNAINYYAPMIFEQIGIKGTNTNLFATGIYGIMKMVACLAFLIFAADSLGRRKSLLWTSIAQGCAMFWVGIYIRVWPPVPGADVPGQGYLALVCVFLFAAFFQFGWGPCCWIYISEIPAARLRALNVAIGAATQWLFNFVVGRATPNMMATMGRNGYGTFFTYGSFCFAMFFFVWFLIPETKGLSLEAMDDLFGVSELVKKIEAEAAETGVEPRSMSLSEKVNATVKQTEHVEVTGVHPSDRA